MVGRGTIWGGGGLYGDYYVIGHVFVHVIVHESEHFHQVITDKTKHFANILLQNFCNNKKRVMFLNVYFKFYLTEVGGEE